MELVERFDKKRLPLNKTVERYNPVPGEYDQVVHLWIMNENGEFLMQKRSLQKRINPGKWSVTGGAVDVGEKSIDGLYRECKEEIGIDLNPEKVELMMSLKLRHVFVDIYLDKENFDTNEFKLQKEEVDKVQWADRNDIKNLINDDEISNSIKMYFDLLCNLIDQNNT